MSLRKGRDRERLFHEISSSPDRRALDHGHEISSSEFKGADHEIDGLNLRIAAGWQVVLRPNERLGLVLRRTRSAHELETVVSDGGDTGDVFAEQIARRAEERAFQLDALEWELDARAERLRNKEAHLTAWEQQIRTQRMSGAPGRAVAKVGRNERCPCGSGLKYKHCHGHAGHPT